MNNKTYQFLQKSNSHPSFIRDSIQFFPRTYLNPTFQISRSNMCRGLVALGLSTRKWVFCQGATMPSLRHWRGPP